MRNWLALILLISFCLSGCSQPTELDLKMERIEQYAEGVAVFNDWTKTTRHTLVNPQGAVATYFFDAAGLRKIIVQMPGSTGDPELEYTIENDELVYLVDRQTEHTIKSYIEGGELIQQIASNDPDKEHNKGYLIREGFRIREAFVGLILEARNDIEAFNQGQ